MTRTFWVTALATATAAAQTPPPSPCRVAAVTGCSPALVRSAEHLVGALDSLAALPTPRDASTTDRPEAVRFGTWLRNASGRVAAHAALPQRGAGLKGGARLDYLAATTALRARLLAEGEKFVFTSPGLKTRHEAAMSSIRNLK